MNRILVDHVWSGHPVGFALLTDRGHQFIAYYDADRRIAVAGRKVDEAEWIRVRPEGVPVPKRDRMSNVTGWDSHNYLTLSLDKEGCLHLSGNMHADPLNYWRTEKPFDLGSLRRIDRMTGEREDSTTYPGFLTLSNGDLLFRYRDGGSGNGSDFYNRYDPETRQWSRFIDGPLFDGEGKRSAYSTGPTRGPDGLYHTMWMWRDTPDAMSNHTLSYARSADLLNWESSGGTPIQRPIRHGHAEVVDDSLPEGGLVNMCFSLGWDNERRPIAVYHRFDPAGHSQIFAARPQGDGSWLKSQLSDWNFRWDFRGNGSQEKQISVDAPHAEGEGGFFVGYRSKEAGAGRWRLNPKTLAVLETIPDKTDKAQAGTPAALADAPGLSEKSIQSKYQGRRWQLSWKTLGVNRDMAHKDSPPPSAMWLTLLDPDP